jgi:hypothetical protein
MAEKLERNEICNLLENIQSVIDEIQIPAARVKNRSKFLQQIFSMIAKNRLEEAAEFIYSRKSNRFESHFRKSDQKTTGLE